MAEKTPEEIAAEQAAKVEADAREKAEVESLQVEARALGVKVDNRWKAERLREEIAEAKAGKEAAEPPPYESPIEFVVVLARIALHFDDAPAGSEARVVESGHRVRPESESQFRTLQVLESAGHVRAVART